MCDAFVSPLSGFYVLWSFLFFLFFFLRVHVETFLRSLLRVRDSLRRKKEVRNGRMTARGYFLVPVVFPRQRNKYR